MSRIGLTLVLSLAVAVHADFPDDPKPCKYGDTECFVEFCNRLITEKATEGDDSLNLIQLDPLIVDKMVLKQGANGSPVNIDLTFTNNKLYGNKDLRFKKMRYVLRYFQMEANRIYIYLLHRGFGKEIATKHEMVMSSKVFSLVGEYAIKGQVLVLPISGTGYSNMTLMGSDVKISFTGKPVEKNGEMYMEASDLKYTVKPKDQHFYFTNLFNGDKTLGDTMNTFLNENSAAIFSETKESIEKAFSAVYEPLITRVFSKYPYAKYFAAEEST
ncbi:blast:Protein takeout [Drosophila guanche]|uniref:Blast:Protein takeout n=1 Tax=Drosophila guanche TaxID=7266 RepID=A0A3B0KFI3_DROGU|nr:blast:Protein takeout [Drosophila guanche]